MTNNSLRRLCLTATIAFIAGAVFLLIAIVALKSFEPNRSQRKGKAYTFFYKTMHEFFEGNYNFEEGSVSKQALETFKKYESRLGDKCQLFIYDDSSSDYFAGIAFFPTGDCFSVAIIRLSEERNLLKSLDPVDWESLWTREMQRIENDSKQPQE